MTLVALEPVPVLVVVDHDLLHRLDGRRDDDDLRRLVRGPRLPVALRRGLQRHRRTERIAARAAHPRHAPVVHEHGRPGLQHGLVAGDLAVLEAVVRDPGVQPQLHRGQRAQVRGNGRRPDAERRREGLVRGGRRGQDLDLLLDVAARHVLGAPVDARGGAADAPGARGGALGGGGGTGRGGGRCRALRWWSVLLDHGGLGEGVGSGRGGGLEEHLGPGARCAVGPGQHHHQDHGRDHRDERGGEPWNGPPPRTLARPRTAGTGRTARRSGRRRRRGSRRSGRRRRRGSLLSARQRPGRRPGGSL